MSSWAPNTVSAQYESARRGSTSAVDHRRRPGTSPAENIFQEPPAGLATILPRHAKGPQGIPEVPAATGFSGPGAALQSGADSSALPCAQVRGRGSKLAGTSPCPWSGPNDY